MLLGKYNESSAIVTIYQVTALEYVLPKRSVTDTVPEDGEASAGAPAEQY